MKKIEQIHSLYSGRLEDGFLKRTSIGIKAGQILHDLQRG